MGMSIEDIIQGLKETNMICNSVFAYDRKKYIDGAIDKLCKYQMIVQIVENVDKRYYGYSTMMDYLHEVVGNDNK